MEEFSTFRSKLGKVRVKSGKFTVKSRHFCIKYSLSRLGVVKTRFPARFRLVIQKYVCLDHQLSNLDIPSWRYRYF